MGKKSEYQISRTSTATSIYKELTVYFPESGTRASHNQYLSDRKKAKVMQNTVSRYKKLFLSETFLFGYRFSRLFMFWLFVIFAIVTSMLYIIFGW